MSYEIAIPSYQRAQTLKDKTLKYLLQSTAPLSRVTIFVSDEKAKEDYEKIIGTDLKIVVAVSGMRAVRNFIQNYYDDGVEVFNLDDDLEGIYQKLNDKQMMKVHDLDGMVKDTFARSREAGCRLWGVYPVCNPFFMKKKFTKDLRYIVGCTWGVVNSKDPKLAVTLDDKEDFERTIKFYLEDGGVYRLGEVAPKTNYYKEPGGMQVERTVKRVQNSAQILAEKFPELCTLVTRKDHWEVRLKDSRGKTQNKTHK